MKGEDVDGMTSGTLLEFEFQGWWLGVSFSSPLNEFFIEGWNMNHFRCFLNFHHSYEKNFQNSKEFNYKKQISSVATVNQEPQTPEPS